MQDRASTTDPTAPAVGVLLRLIEEAWPAADWRDLNVAVAVSGGADSVALLRAITALKRRAAGRGEVFVLHFNHRVRGEVSATDAAWVESLAQNAEVGFVGGRSASVGPRSEESLRDERRDFYVQSASQTGARFLATGHTADDQAETVLFRLLRGSGLHGLAGIRPFATLNEQCTLVRPLLSATREQVVSYLATLGQAHREDETNASDNYNRNWLRHRVLPLLAERFHTAAENLAASAARTAATADLVDALAAELLAKTATVENANRIVIQIGELATQPAALVVEALRLAWRRVGWPEQKMRADHWHRLAALASADAASEVAIFPGSVRVERSRQQLVLARSAEPDEETVSC